jgi:glutaminyl-tRNA synthetase
MAVLRPLRVVITNYPEGASEWLDAPYWPHDVPKEGSRSIPFSHEIYIDRDDFREDPPKKYFRLAPGREVRLRYGYFITCTNVIKDDRGEILELHCTYDPETRGGNAPDGRKVRGTIHWVSAQHALPAEVRLYDRLFTVPDPEAGEESFIDHLNPDSLVVLKGCAVEPSVSNDDAATRYQFERKGYFWRDPEESIDGPLVFNQIVPLRDSWGKIEERGAGTKHRAAADEGASARDADEASRSDNRGRPELSNVVQEAPSPSVDERIGALSARQRSRFDRLTGDSRVSDDEALILAENPEMVAYFEDVLTSYDNPQSVAKWIVHELLREIKGRSIEKIGVAPHQLAELVRLVDERTISGRIAKEVLEQVINTGDDPSDIVAARGLRQVSDPEDLSPVIDAVIKSNSQKVGQYRDGKKGLIGFFMGQVMRQTGGKANPEMVREMLEKRLEG